MPFATYHRMVWTARDPKDQLLPTPVCVGVKLFQRCVLPQICKNMNLFPVPQKASWPRPGWRSLSERKGGAGVGDLGTAWKSYFSREREFTPSLVSSQVIPQLTPGTCTPSPDRIPWGFKSLQYSVTLSFILCQHKSHNGLQTQVPFFFI